ncbi:fimbrial assembly protein [Porphyromonas gingivalis]|uniref:fimbrial protein n=1 Tax=Porphyromonas gingivalis TaxID=837 RepID=UPI000B4D0244|nr:fimbrial protein [Porphyromonas gingivalis]OWP29661.1 fimbrial assembly protein [Porphyromonas gingivalis]
MKMKYFHHPSGLLPRLLLLLLLTMGAVACTKEDNPDQPTSDEVATVKMSLDDVEMRDGDLYSGEDLIKKVRIFVFREGLNGLWVLDRQKLFASGQSDFQNPFTISAHAGPRQIYVIANEPDALTTKLDKILFKKELEDMQAPDVNGPIAQPFTMTGMATATLNPQGTVQANISLNRIAAKITLDIKQVTPGSDVIKITKVQILRNAKNSRLLEGTNKPTGYWNWENAYDLPLTNNGSTQSIIPASAPLYVYENIGSGSDSDSSGRATQLVVEALYNGIKTRYYAYVNDKTTTADHHYSIHRNHHYKLDGTITKMGEFSSLLLTTTVLPWTVENLNYGFLVPYVAEINPHEVIMQDNVVTFENSLSFTVKIKGRDGSRWKATLDNGLEFGFDSGSAIEGDADGISVYTIKVKALKPIGIQRRANLFFTVDGKKVILDKNINPQPTDIKIIQQGL